ncbi:MAG: OB-fold nucleic acid binding domain-containing protein [Vicinamibacteria bacterium]
MTVGGIVAGFRPLKTKKGDRMGVFSLEDHQGSVEVVAFPETFGRHASLIENGQLVLVRGKFERDEESSRFQANELSRLETLKERLARSVQIHLDAAAHSRDTVEALWDLLRRHEGDRPVTVEMDVETGGRRLRVRADVTTQIRVRPSDRLVAEVEQLCGAGSVTLR